MRIVVAGAAGFIGSNFVRLLAAGRYGQIEEIKAVDKLTYAGSWANLRNLDQDRRVSLVEGDICDASLLNTVIRSGDIIVNFAAESHVDRSIQNVRPFVETNVVGTSTLLEVACRVKAAKFIQVSSDEVYGSIARGSASENTIFAPSSPYSASKAAGDLLCYSYFKTFGLNITITRGANTYGFYQFPEKLIPRFITLAIKSEYLPLYGDGRNTRDWIHVDDHCDGIFAAIIKGRAGEAYNLCGQAELSNLQVAERILSLTGKPLELMRHIADRPGHDFRYSLDGSKALSELGFQPRKTFDEGLAETVQWYQDNRWFWDNPQ